LLTLFEVVVLSTGLASVASANCEHIAPGQSFWIRLLDPVSSYSSKPGTKIRAVLIQSPDCDGAAVFPAGVEVDGEVISKRRVGMGFVHDTAKLEVQFDQMVTSTGDVLPIASEVVEVDNAREHVRHGVIQGIRATNTPQGRITSGLIHLPTYNPYGDAVLIVYRAVFTILPEPEIYLPPGTDLRLQLNVPLYVGDQPELPRVSFQMDEYQRGEVEMMLQKVSPRTMTGKGQDADLINFLFLGTREQISTAFQAAGWVGADKTTAKSVFRQMGAFLTYSNYRTAPISRQFVNSEPQDITWQRSFNSYGKREHLRLWDNTNTVGGEQAWLGAYTRETGAALSVSNQKFIHHIDRNLDDGANMLVRDLSLAGCVKSVRLMPRPEVQKLLTNATGDEMRTDGDLTVVQMANCDGQTIVNGEGHPLIQTRPRRRIARYFRTQVLVYKSDVIRGNIIYSIFDLARMSIYALRKRRHHVDPDEEDEGLPLSPVSPQTLFPQMAFNYSLLGQ
jgi:LssY C-terminus